MRARAARRYSAAQEPSSRKAWLAAFGPSVAWRVVPKSASPEVRSSVPQLVAAQRGMSTAASNTWSAACWAIPELLSLGGSRRLAIVLLDLSVYRMETIRPDLGGKFRSISLDIRCTKGQNLSRF